MAKRPCARYPACRALVQSGLCDACKPKYDRRKLADEKRPSAAKRGYGRRWQAMSKAYLRAHPIAFDWFKEHNGRIFAAEVVDHIVPHRGDMKLFWDSSNWQGLTKRDHDRKTAMEDGGFGRGVGHEMVSG
jgi:5-methylcytosine-specific restriction protein A